eukprot:CAMPEP_0198531188 /NCGR_PEP_ID=MMETSP1462-20131121/26794_1 /TAXON_ID=1333877 /ORGANISM="Brandtodinium nutriculum, Strain RCC3387" /LENGTH=470 /DNA_ID=CAMNT_0044261073 /DNA_START=1 /DNA_END=1409 /DNA_ORIENTATION=+
MGVTTDRERAVFFAKLAEQAERYDEMVCHMLDVVGISQELSDEEMTLFSVAYKNVVGSRRAAWQCMQATKEGKEAEADAFAFAYQETLVGEIDSICSMACNMLSEGLMLSAHSAEVKVFYQKMKADTFRDIASVRPVDARLNAAEEARQAYEEASQIATSHLPETHPLRFGLALNRSVFHSQVLGNSDEACRSAPTALRHLAPWDSLGGGVSPRGPTSAAVVSQRLCDLLLEYPMAAISGVRWTALLRSYAEVYGQSVDLFSLGYSSAAAAARGMLVDVLQCQPREHWQASEEEDSEDPLLRIDDEVALTPLPGFAGSWPSLYRTLCTIVQGCGQQEEADEPAMGVEPGTSIRVLLLSQLRPLLLQGDAPSSQAQPLRSLLEQLRPCSKMNYAGGDENGLCFRDEEGSFRRLQKMGHWVKAVLLWRDQRVQWLATCDIKPGKIDEVLCPQLQLVFSKRRNNLVLALTEPA